MSKHKRLHSIGGKGKYSKFAGFVSSHYPPPRKICYTGEDKKNAPQCANAKRPPVAGCIIVNHILPQGG